MEALETRFIRITGGVGEVVHQNIERRFASSELVELVQQMGGMNTGLLPYDCVYMREGKFEEGNRSYEAGLAYRLHVCMDRPHIMNFRFQGHDVGEKGEEDETVRTFKLAMPWLVTAVLYINNGLSQVRLLALLDADGLAKLGLDAQLYCIPLPNLSHGTGVFCLGDFKMDSVQPFWERTNLVRNYIRESIWNNDLWPVLGTDDRSTPSVKSLQHWAEETAKHGQGFWRVLKLQPAATPTVEKLIGGMVS